MSAASKDRLRSCLALRVCSRVYVPQWRKMRLSAPVSVSSARTSDGAAYDTVESDTKTGPTTLRDPVHSPAALDEGRTSEFMDCKFQARAFPYSSSNRLHAFSASDSL